MYRSRCLGPDAGLQEGELFFVVITGQGGAWDVTRSMREQDRWTEHAAFMHALADDGFVVLGGPLGDASKALLIVNAASQQAARRRLAEDPWAQLRPIELIEPWEVLLGDLPAASTRSST